MSFSITSNNISTSSGKIAINDGIAIYKDKILETDKFFFVDNFVIEKDVSFMPILYIACHAVNSANIATMDVDINTGEITNNNNFAVEVFKPSYSNSVIKLIHSNATSGAASFMWSMCSSSMDVSSAASEKNNFLSGKPLLSENYTKANVPVINITPTIITTSISDQTKPCSIKIVSQTAKKERLTIQGNINLNSKWAYIIVMAQIKL